MDDLGFLDLDPTMLANMGSLDERKALAQQLMATQMPEGQRVGGTYVAPNPLQFLNSALRQGIGAHQNKRLLGQQDQGREAYIRALVQQLQGQEQPPEQPFVDSPQMY